EARVFAATVAYENVPCHSLGAPQISHRVDNIGRRRASKDPVAPSGCSDLPGLLAPGREGFVEGALAGRTLFDRDDGAALVDVNQRHVKPRTLLQELDIAGAVGLDIGKPDQEEAVDYLDREAGERRAAGLLVGFHQDARHVADAAAGEILRQDERQLRG